MKSILLLLFPIISGLQSEDFDTRQRATDRLVKMGGESVPVLVYGLWNGDPDLRYRCEQSPLSHKILRVEWLPDLVTIHQIFTKRETGRTIENGNYYISEADLKKLTSIGGPKIKSIVEHFGWNVNKWRGGWEFDIALSHSKDYVEAWCNVIRQERMGWR